MSIIKTIVMCGKQDILIWGYWDSGQLVVEISKSENTNEDNYRELLWYRALYDAHLKNVLEGPTW